MLNHIREFVAVLYSKIIPSAARFVNLCICPVRAARFMRISIQITIK
mgnify:CR=1 FL=1